MGPHLLYDIYDKSDLRTLLCSLECISLIIRILCKTSQIVNWCYETFRCNLESGRLGFIAGNRLLVKVKFPGWFSGTASIKTETDGSIVEIFFLDRFQCLLLRRRCLIIFCYFIIFRVTSSGQFCNESQVRDMLRQTTS